MGIVDVDLGPTRDIEVMHDQRFVDLTFEVRSLLKGDSGD